MHSSPVIGEREKIRHHPHSGTDTLGPHLSVLPALPRPHPHNQETKSAQGPSTWSKEDRNLQGC